MIANSEFCRMRTAIHIYDGLFPELKKAAADTGRTLAWRVIDLMRCARSSVDRALPSGGRGRGFESLRARNPQKAR